MSVNVNRSVSDQFYRYKMPRLIAKVIRIFILVASPKLLAVPLFFLFKIVSPG